MMARVGEKGDALGVLEERALHTPRDRERCPALPCDSIRAGNWQEQLVTPFYRAPTADQKVLLAARFSALRSSDRAV